MSFSDQSLRTFIGNLLRLGVTLAGAIVCFGAVLYLMRHGSETANYRVFSGHAEAFGSVLTGVRELRARSIIQLGLVVLIATPVARVLVSAAGFARERDWRYVAVSAIVLAFLIIGWSGQ